ncbi:MAG: VCBS repeat-containing protein, partial [Acidobacteria bacterium]|nr:VCBS repeat-containing protein [Acidobacteriota bacterium]
MGAMDLLRATKRQGPLLLVLAAAALAQSQSHVWETRGFEAFRAGQFPAANLYVSRAGVLETIHRWDFNDDGYFDLIFNNTHDLAYTPPAYVYTFAGRQPERREFAGAGSVHALASDLNGDTHPELVIVRGFDNTTRALNSRIYWGSPGGPARWSERRHLELHTPYVEDACAADLNRDGRPDLVFLSASENSQVYWGQPDGYFHGNRTAFATPKAAGCLAADLDGDGATDLLASGQEARVFWSGDLKHSSPAPAGSAAALLGKRLVLSTKGGPQIFSIRNRAFHLEQEISFPGGGRTAAADLNRDGAADLVVTRAVVDRKWETASRIFWGSGAAGQERFDRSRYLDLATSGALDVAVSDLDGDGFPDIVFANSRSSLSSDVDSWVYWGGPGGYGADHRTSLATHGAQRASIAGRSVVFANSVSGRPIGDIDTYIYLGDREGSYSSERIVRLPTIGGYESCGADLNGDGASDLVLVGSHEGDMASATGSYIYWGSRE